jgi:hypothetical protein
VKADQLKKNPFGTLALSMFRSASGLSLNLFCNLPAYSHRTICLYVITSKLSHGCQAATTATIENVTAEDNGTINDHMTVMQNEMSSSVPNLTVIDERMTRTYDHQFGLVWFFYGTPAQKGH